MKDKFYNFFAIIGEYAFYGLLFFMPISISLVEIFANLMLLGFVGRKVIKPDFKFIRFWPNILILLFLFFGALSLLNSGQYIKISIHALFGKWIQYLSVYILLQDRIYDRKMINRGMVIFLLSAALIVLSGLSQYFFRYEFLRGRGMTIMDCGWYAMTSSFAHYNSFGAYLVVVLLLTTTLLVADDCYGLKAVCLLLLSIFSTIAVMFTFSRGSWLSLAVLFIILSIFGRKKIERLIPIFLVIIVISYFPQISERLWLVFGFNGDADRFRYWDAAFKMVNQHPFLGIGLGTFMANFSNYLPNLRISYAHNCYLQIWAETGIFSLIIFIVFVVSLVYAGIRKFLRSRDFLLLGLLLGAMGFLVHSFFDANLYSLQLAFLFWVWVGLVAARSSAVYK